MRDISPILHSLEMLPIKYNIYKILAFNYNEMVKYFLIICTDAILKNIYTPELVLPVLRTFYSKCLLQFSKSIRLYSSLN